MMKDGSEHNTDDVETPDSLEGSEKPNEIDKVAVAFVAHPVQGDVKANLDRGLRWLRWLIDHYDWFSFNLCWESYCRALDDAVPEQRARGMRDVKAQLVQCNALFVVGGVITPGMTEEIELAHEECITVYDLTSLGPEPPELTKKEAWDLLETGYASEAELVEASQGYLGDDEYVVSSRDGTNHMVVPKSLLDDPSVEWIDTDLPWELPRLVTAEKQKGSLGEAMKSTKVAKDHIEALRRYPQTKVKLPQDFFPIPDVPDGAPLYYSGISPADLGDHEPIPEEAVCGEEIVADVRKLRAQIPVNSAGEPDLFGGVFGDGFIPEHTPEKQQLSEKEKFFVELSSSLCTDKNTKHFDNRLPNVTPSDFGDHEPIPEEAVYAEPLVSAGENIKVTWYQDQLRDQLRGDDECAKESVCFGRFDVAKADVVPSRESMASGDSDKSDD